MSTPLRIAIVGGGITGLAAAHRLIELSQSPDSASRRPIQVTLFEAGARLGGIIATQQIQGYSVELGPDSFITNKPWAVDLCRRLGIEDQLIPTDAKFRRSFVLRRGKPVVVPDGFQLLTPVQVWPVLKSSIFSWYGKLRMGCEFFLPARRDSQDESLGSFVRRRFGRETLDRLVQPLVGGIYTSDPEKLSLQATLPRFLEMERNHGSLIRASRKAAAQGNSREHATGARYGLFATPEAGTGQIAKALEQRIAGRVELLLKAPVTNLKSLSGGGFRLEFGQNAEARDFDRIIFTVPTYRIADFVEGLSPVWASALREIEYASTTIVVSGHRLSDVAHPLDAFGLVIPAIEKRKVLAVSFTSRKFPNRAPDGHVQLRTFVGGAMQPELFQLSDAETKQLVRSELGELLGVRGEPVFEIVARYPRSMPQYHVGHVQRVARIRELGQAWPGIALAGSAYDGVGIPDSIHSGEQAAEAIMRGNS